MRTSTIVALSACSLALMSTAAWADETAKPAPKGKTIVVEMGPIKGVRQVPLSIDVNRLVPRAPLPELRKPLVDRIAAAVEKDPF